MPGALRAAGLLHNAHIDGGNLQVTLADPRRHPVTNVTASDDLLAASRVLCDATYDIAREGLTPLFVGGDCSMLIGIMNGLRRHDPDLALVLVDGHFDMHTPETSESGDAADMEVILLTDPASPFASLDGSTPVLSLERIAFIGPRDHGEMTRLGSPLPHNMTPRPFIADQPALAHTTVLKAATAASAHLRRAGATAFWLHIDLDVLATDEMPAVDYPQPGGLSWADLYAATRSLIEDPGFRGISVADLNPNLDEHGTAAKNTAEWLNTVLSRQQEIDSD
jgi:arginase